MAHLVGHARSDFDKTMTGLDLQPDRSSWPIAVRHVWGPLWQASYSRLGKTSRLWGLGEERTRRRMEELARQEARRLAPLLLEEAARRGLSRPPMAVEALDYASVERRFPDRELVGAGADCSLYEDQSDGHYLILEPLDQAEPLEVLSFADGASQLLYEAAQGLERFSSRAEALGHLQRRLDARRVTGR